MAVSIDKVYQKVLALANKEQRGYITPQEFNLFADHAQTEIFEQYFYDLEQFERRVDDTSDLISDKISIFGKLIDLGQTNDFELSTIPDFYKIIQVTKQFTGNYVGGVAQQIQYKDYHALATGKLTQPTKTRPVFYIHSNSIHIHPKNTPDMENSIRYIRTPHKPNWTYVIHNQTALYNPDGADHQDFELHASEESALVVKILQLAGVSIKDFGLAQVAGQKEISTIQQEKQ